MPREYKQRVIVDTNCWISFLIGRRLSRLVDLLSDERIQLIICDELLAEMTLPNSEFMDGLMKTCKAHEKCEFQVGFFLSEWNEKKIQNIKVFNLTKLMM